MTRIMQIRAEENRAWGEVTALLKKQLVAANRSRRRLRILFAVTLCCVVAAALSGFLLWPKETRPVVYGDCSRLTSTEASCVNTGVAP